MPDFIPANDDAFLAWVTPFSAKITATPTAYGLTAGIATTLATKKTTFATALAAAQDPQTRGQSTIFAKDTAREDLEAYCRQTARQVQGTLTVTDQQRQDLGLTVRDTQPTPVPPPSQAPDIDILSVTGRTVRIRVHEPNSTRRGKPDGVDGVAVFSFIGAEAPTDPALWKFEGNTSLTTTEVTFANTVEPGAQVWMTAMWFNPTFKSGPPATPVSVIFGSASMAA